MSLFSKLFSNIFEFKRVRLCISAFSMLRLFDRIYLCLLLTQSIEMPCNFTPTYSSLNMAFTFANVFAGIVAGLVLDRKDMIPLYFRSIFAIVQVISVITLYIFKSSFFVLVGSFMLLKFVNPLLMYGYLKSFKIKIARKYADDIKLQDSKFSSANIIGEIIGFSLLFLIWLGIYSFAGAHKYFGEEAHYRLFTVIRILFAVHFVCISYVSGMTLLDVFQQFQRQRDIDMNKPQLEENLINNNNQNSTLSQRFHESHLESPRIDTKENCRTRNLSIVVKSIDDVESACNVQLVHLNDKDKDANNETSKRRGSSNLLLGLAMSDLSEAYAHDNLLITSKHGAESPRGSFASNKIELYNSSDLNYNSAEMVASISKDPELHGFQKDTNATTGNCQNYVHNETSLDFSSVSEEEKEKPKPNGAIQALRENSCLRSAFILMVIIISFIELVTQSVMLGAANEVNPELPSEHDVESQKHIYTLENNLCNGLLSNHFWQVVVATLSLIATISTYKIVFSSMRIDYFMKIVHPAMMIPISLIPLLSIQKLRNVIHLTIDSKSLNTVLPVGVIASTVFLTYYKFVTMLNASPIIFGTIMAFIAVADNALLFFGALLSLTRPLYPVANLDSMISTSVGILSVILSLWFVYRYDLGKEEREAAKRRKNEENFDHQIDEKKPS